MNPERKIKKFKRELDELDMTLSEFQARFPLPWLQDNYTTLNHERHDIIGEIFMKENGISSDSMDINPFDKVLSFLELEGEISLLVKFQERRKEPRYNRIKYTPDIVEVSKRDDRILIEIIDFTVSRDPEKAYGSKFEKYNVYRDFFEDFDVNLTIVCYDIHQRELKVRTWGAERKYNIPDVSEISELIEKSEEIKLLISSKVPPEDKEEFDTWLYGKFDDEINGRESLRNFDCSITKEEFKEFFKNSRNMNKFFAETSEDHKELFWEILMHFSLEDDIIDEVENIRNSIDPKSLPIKKKEVFRSKLNSMEVEYRLAAQAHEPKKGLPSEPSPEAMKEAIKVVKEKAMETYERKDREGLLFPIPFNFSKKPIKEKGPLLKKRRLEKLNGLVNEVLSKKEYKNDSIMRAISCLLAQAKVKDEDYQSFINGDFVLTDKGEKIETKEFRQHLREENEKKMRELQKSNLMEHHELLEDEMKRGKVRGIFMKKGEVISIRPNRDRDVDAFKETAGVGKKVSYTDREYTEINKVKSLPFWEESMSERYNEKFLSEVDKLTMIIRNISKMVKEDRNHLKESSPENSSLNRGSSEEDETEDMKSFKEDYWNGLNFYLRSYERLFENLNFVSYMANSGFRIVQGLSDNSFIITMPSESLFKGDTSVPYICISLEEKDDIHYSFCDDNETIYRTTKGNVYVTMGRRLDRNRLTGYLRMKPMVETAIHCINHFRKESRIPETNPYEMTKLLFFIGNININTSSVLDNVRYMTELCMSNFSFCQEYIMDKLMVPTKNILQVHLFRCLEKLMYSLYEDMKSVKVRQAIVDEEGGVNMDSARITKGEFHSFFFSDAHRYQKMEGLISEITVLFFSITKGLHGKYHNLAEIHMTPLKIEREIRERNEKMCPMADMEVKKREEFDPLFVVLAYRKAEDSITLGREQVRERFLNAEKINQSPLSGKTTASTRSTLIEDNSVRFLHDDSMSETFADNPNFSFMSQEEQDRMIQIFSKLENRTRMLPAKEIKRIIKKEKEAFIEDMKDPLKKEKVKELFEHKIKFDMESRRFSLRTIFGKDKFKEEALKIIEESRRNSNLDDPRVKEILNENIQFHTSGVVVSEVIKNAVVKNEEEKTFWTIGEYAKECVLQKEDWVFGIRPKGQRTQKDREIFVLDLQAKFGLYPLEHFYKQMSTALPEEKISEPGDDKIRTLKSQVESGFKWISRMLGVQRKGDMDSMLKPSILHFNLDMTKWAPRDNLFKFIYCVAACKYLRLEEKLYMISALFKLSEKMMYIDEELIVKSYWSNKRRPEGVESNCIFQGMTNDYLTNKVPITLTWLQGQLNYISSFLHGGMTLFWYDSLKKAYGDTIRIYINVHSDDNQMSVYSFKNLDDQSFVNDLWRKLDYYARLCCIEISIKKSYISTIIKQFISQYNIAGEQIYPWVKNMMSSISGCPYTVLKDDISSVVSKVSEGLAKGAPKGVASIVIKLMSEHVLNIYGIRKGLGENAFSELLGVKQEHLPMCLGGSNIFDYTTLAIGGPRSVDQMILMDILRPFGATSVQEPGDRPASSMRLQSSRLEALKLFLVLDQLSSETPEEDENVSFSGNLNPLKSTRFKMRRTGRVMPFGDMTEEERLIKAAEFKSKSPALAFMKPRNNIDLVKYYFLLFCNSSFKASLAGQSPALLMMHKLVNKKKGLFRIKESSDVTLSKFEHDKTQKTNLTHEELANLLKKLMDKVDPTPDCARYLWNKYIKCDPEFKILWYVKENCKSSGAVTKPNPFPIRKPNFSEYSEILNRIPVLLAYFFDYDFFKRNEMKLEFKRALPNDVEALLEIFPREMKYLFVAWMEERKDLDNGTLNIEEVDMRYHSFDKFMRDLSTQEKGRFNMKLKNLSAMSNTLEKRLREGIEAELKEMRQETGVMPTLVEIIQESKFKETESYDIADRLLKMSRSFKMETKKILFCPPSISKEISDVALAMRSQVESFGRICVSYTLTHTQGQTARILKLMNINLKSPKLREFGIAVSNLYSLALRLGIDRTNMIDLMKSARMFDVRMVDLKEEFKNLPRFVQSRVLCPLSLCFEEDSDKFLNMHEPMTILWLEVEETPGDRFRSLVRYENVEMDVKGSARKIEACTIRYSGNLDSLVVNKMMKTFISDLHTRTRNNAWKFRIFDNYPDRRNKLPEEKPLIGYSTMRDMVVSGKSESCDQVFKKMTLTPVEDINFVRRVRNVRVSDDLESLEFEEMGVNEKIKHKDYRTQSLLALDFTDKVIEGISMKRLSELSAYRHLMVGDFTKVSISDYLDVVVYPGLITNYIGGFSALATLENFIHINEQSKGALEDLMIYIRKKKEYKEGISRSYPVLKMSEELGEKENQLKLKMSMWAEVMEKKRELSLQYASSYITFLDLSSEIFEYTQLSGVNLDEMLIPEVDHDEMERVIKEEMKRMGLELLLKEANPDPMKSQDHQIQSYILYSFILARADDPRNFDRDMSKILSSRVKHETDLNTKVLEKSCLHCGHTAVEALEANEIPDIWDMEYLASIEKYYMEMKHMLSFETVRIYKMWNEYSTMRKKFKPEVTKISSFFMGETSGRGARRKSRVSAMAKAARDNPMEAYEARGVLSKTSKLFEKSKEYESGTQTEETTDIETDKEVQKEVKALRTTYKGLRVGKGTKLAIAREKIKLKHVKFEEQEELEIPIDFEIPEGQESDDDNDFMF